MKVSSPNDVKIYTIASSSITALPEWLSQKKKKQLRYDPNYSQRVELLQDFEFPEAATCLKATRDGQYIVAAGVYKPQYRVFELSQMSMKFDRHLHANTVQFEILSDDWRKMVMLQADRTVEFHSPSGLHYKTRIPKFGRDLTYSYTTADLLVGCSGSEVYRLNLEQGRFMKSLETDSSGVNCVEVNHANQLWSTGGEDGGVELYDHRTKDRLYRLELQHEVTCMANAQDGLTWAAGTNNGQVLMFDMRAMSKPLLQKDHQYDLPMRKIIYHESTGNVFSADTKIIKLWNKNTGKLVTSIEPEDDINDMLVQDGLIMTANECSRMNIFFVPQIGPAPKWCSFLDNLTEELEETTQQNVYDDYKFVTKKELAHLGLDHLMGTNLLKAYMHGFFIDMRLYEKAKAIANPFAYEDYKKRIIKDKLQEKSASRISATRKLPSVNKEMAAKLMEKGQELDDRFQGLFKDQDFQIDKYDDEYVKFHTTAPKPVATDHFDNVSSESELEGVASEDYDSDASDVLVRTPQKQKVKMYESRPGQSVQHLQQEKSHSNFNSFADRLEKESFDARNRKLSPPTNGAVAMQFQVKSQSGGAGRSQQKQKRRVFKK